MNTTYSTYSGHTVEAEIKFLEEADMIYCKGYEAK